jgi:uncharacterized protein (UPF0333 family)
MFDLIKYSVKGFMKNKKGDIVHSELVQLILKVVLLIVVVGIVIYLIYKMTSEGDKVDDVTSFLT